MAFDIYSIFSITYQAPFVRFLVEVIALFTGLLLLGTLSGNFLKNGSRRYIGIIGVILFFSMMQFFAGIALVEPFFGGIISPTMKGVEELLLAGAQLRVKTLIFGALVSAIALAYIVLTPERTIEQDRRKQHLTWILTEVTVSAVLLYAAIAVFCQQVIPSILDTYMGAALQASAFLSVVLLAVVSYKLRENYIETKSLFSLWIGAAFIIFASAGAMFLFMKDIWDLFGWLSTAFRLLANTVLVYALIAGQLEN
jgi:hypothetical protein